MRGVRAVGRARFLSPGIVRRYRGVLRRSPPVEKAKGKQRKRGERRERDLSSQRKDEDKPVEELVEAALAQKNLLLETHAGIRVTRSRPGQKL